MNRLCVSLWCFGEIWPIVLFKIELGRWRGPIQKLEELRSLSGALQKLLRDRLDYLV